MFSHNGPGFNSRRMHCPILQIFNLNGSLYSLFTFQIMPCHLKTVWIEVKHMLRDLRFNITCYSVYLIQDDFMHIIFKILTHNCIVSNNYLLRPYWHFFPFIQYCNVCELSIFCIIGSGGWIRRMWCKIQHSHS